VNPHLATDIRRTHGKNTMIGCNNSHAAGPAGTALSSQTNPPCHILVAEDDEFFRRLNTQVLLRSGYEVDTTADGAAAWQALNANPYDLLITDNMMPKLSGVELLKRLRAARMALPVILASGASPEQEFSQAPWLRPAATLLKPYSGEEMLRTVKSVFREAESTAAGSQLPMENGMKDNKTSHVTEPANASCQRPIRSTHRILVVDEDRDIRQLYVDALAGPGYHVDATDNGTTAWETLKANRYNLLITEHEIPNLTGVELIKMLRAARMALPVVMVARRIPTHELARNPLLQLAATLSKPFGIDALLDTVQNVLRATDSAPAPLDPQPTWRDQPSANGLCL
jgi:DNA-binding response OmpR family regulator